MERDNNKIIAEWLGWKNLNYVKAGNTGPHLMGDKPEGPMRNILVPDFAGADSAAITLLPVLLERGEDDCKLLYNHHEHCWQFNIMSTRDAVPRFVGRDAGIAGAIALAVVRFAEAAALTAQNPPTSRRQP